MVSPVDGSQPHSLIYKPTFALMAASWAVCLSSPDLVSLNLQNPVLEAGVLCNSLTQPNEAFVFAGLQINC